MICKIPIGICLFWMFSASTVPAATLPYLLQDTNVDSLASFQRVKDQAVEYMLGRSGNGPYRQKAVQEMDLWVKTVLSVEYERLKWDESAALTMNLKLDSLASILNRLAIAFRSKDSRYLQSEVVKQRIVSGMENVLEHYNPSTPRPGNWFQWLISLPHHLGATTLLMEPYLPQELMVRMMTTLKDQLSTKMVLTGTNAAWEARNHIYLALLTSDYNLLGRAADQVFKAVRFGTKQGVREDYSYLFHGQLPYAGGYGAGFAQTVAEFIYVFDKTPWAISQGHRDLIINLLLEHTRWFLADGQIDLIVRGRTYRNGIGPWGLILEALLVLAQTEGPRKEEVATTAAAMLKAYPQVDLGFSNAFLADRLISVEGELPLGFRYWPTGEIGVFRQPSFHIGFRQYSNRVQDYEYLARTDGGDGGDGWNLPYGFTNILRSDGSGSWFSDMTKGERGMHPNIDMEHLPGTTSRIGGHPQNLPFQPDPKVLTMSTTGFSLNFGTSFFAGGVGWEEGGVAGFVLEPAYGDFSAKKSLHFFPKGFWALGSGISSTEQPLDKNKGSIHTTILQWVSNKDRPVLALADSSIFLVENSTTAMDGIGWLWIEDEDVAVVFKEPTSLFVRFQDGIITLWLDHGAQPSNASYAYAVLPHISIDDARHFVSELPFRPVRHDENVHAVSDEFRERSGMVFFKPDSSLGIKTQSPAIVYHKKEKEGGILTLQDPLHQSGKIELAVDELTGDITLPDSTVKVNRSLQGQAKIEVSSVLGRIYRFGYGEAGKTVNGVPREDLDLSSYHDFQVEATSDPEKTILTVHLPEEAVQDGYELSVHFSKSQRLYDFSEEDILDKPSSNIVRYRWNRNPAKGPSVFSDYLKQTHGTFHVYLVTRLIQEVDSFSVPDFEEE